jgi:ligand-binding SRPBCC domain-containing protein
MVIHTIQRALTSNTPLEKCWSFFGNPNNLPSITPPALNIKVLTETPEEMYPGLMIEYHVRPLFGFGLVWLTEITQVDRLRYFVDEQRIGPYRLWHHEHRFLAVDQERTEMQDIVHYVLPFSPISEIMHGLLVEPQLRQIFDYRERVTRELFKQSSEN